MYFIDANIFLELALDQDKADDCEVFLKRVQNGGLRGVITDFLIDAIIIVMENRGKTPKDLRVFLSSLFGYKGLEVYLLSLLDKIKATKFMELFGFDFDDATTYQAMKRLKLEKIISYDKDFDSLPDVKRLEPPNV